MSSIDIEDVTFCYNQDGDTAPALENINLAIESGEFLCLVGHSGCGKSTLLSLLAGLNLPTTGQITIDGNAIEGPGLSRAMVFQHYSLFPWQTAVKNVAFAIRRADKSISKRDSLTRAHEFLKMVDMEHAADKYPYQLSGGMQQRVAVARALATDSPILLMDEPFGALDAKNRTELQDLLIELRAKSATPKTIVFVTHDLDEAILLADRIVFMRPGHIEREFDIQMPHPRREALLDRTPEYRALYSELYELMLLDEERASQEGDAA